MLYARHSVHNSLQEALSSLLGMYATRQTTAPTVPKCLSCFYNCGQEEDPLLEALNELSEEDFGMVQDTAKLLPGWKPDFGSPSSSFKDTWWIRDLPAYSDGVGYGRHHDYIFEYASEYFQVLVQSISCVY